MFHVEHLSERLQKELRMAEIRKEDDKAAEIIACLLLFLAVVAMIYLP